MSSKKACKAKSMKVLNVKIRGKRCVCTTRGGGFSFRKHSACGLTKAKASRPGSPNRRKKKK